MAYTDIFTTIQNYIGLLMLFVVVLGCIGLAATKDPSKGIDFKKKVDDPITFLFIVLPVALVVAPFIIVLAIVFQGCSIPVGFVRFIIVLAIVFSPIYLPILLLSKLKKSKKKPLRTGTNGGKPFPTQHRASPRH
ncbi:hypothetical protein AWB71_06008 [Caballeronia peredens]|nr:hypothetical protein AWB71_06008 [Caballeronia peredens]